MGSKFFHFRVDSFSDRDKSILDSNTSPESAKEYCFESVKQRWTESNLNITKHYKPFI